MARDARRALPPERQRSRCGLRLDGAARRDSAAGIGSIVTLDAEPDDDEVGSSSRRSRAAGRLVFAEPSVDTLELRP
jgi:hypothetical protein